jgi:catechol 2,3-dioxygenase-like lactoylglutathione lyase family enzyme
MVTPVFLITDYSEALAFYRDWLGFRIDWEEHPGRNRVYIQVSRGAFALHLSSSPADSSTGSVVRLETQGLPTYHRQLLAKKAMPGPPIMGPAYWNPGVLEMEVTDPFGNRLIFCELSGLKV